MAKAGKKVALSKDKQSKKASPGAIAKRKHAHADASATGKDNAARKHKLIQKLEAGAPQAVSARKKKRAKRAAQSTVLGAVSGIAASLDELVAASDARVRGSASTHAQDGGISLSSKKRQQLVVEETQHLQAVLEHPAFVADPFAALQEHLQNTIQPPAEDGQGSSQKKKTAKGKKW